MGQSVAGRVSASTVEDGLTGTTASPGARTRHASRARVRSTGPALGGLLCLGLLALLVGALVPLDGLVVVGGVLVPAVVVRLLVVLLSAFPFQRDVIRAQFQVVLLLADLLVLAAELRADRLSDRGQAVLIFGVLAMETLRALFWGLQYLDGRQQERRVDARNVPDPLPPLPARPPLLVKGGLSAVVLAGTLVPVAISIARLGIPDALVSAAALLAALIVLGVVLAVAPPLLRHSRMTAGKRRVRLVHEAVLRTDPVVILYSTGGPDDLYWVTQWLDTLEHLGRNAVVMLRDPDAMELVPACSVPFVCLPDRFDVGGFRLPTARVAFYVAHGSENVRLLRSRLLRHAYLGHGDSDKGVSASPLARAYEEVWVAGEAARQRHIAADVGFHLDKIRLVGRPQARRVQRQRPPAPGERFAVLYAPSWEGVERNPFESSLLHSGRQIVGALLARPDVRLVYRPHPKTGERNPAFVAEHREIVRMVEQAGTPHEVDRPHESDLIDRFNSADVLISDLSAVLADFLASDKPYFVVNATGVPHDEFRAANASTGGAYLLGPGGESLDAALTDAMGPDTMRERRRATRTALIGAPLDDAVAPFRAAVDALALTARAGKPGR